MKCSEKIAKKWPSFPCVGGLPGVNELPNVSPGLIIKQPLAGFALDITSDSISDTEKTMVVSWRRQWFHVVNIDQGSLGR